MNTNTVDANMLGRMFLAGAKNLEAKKEWINELNVFPVPDGDTGTNMTLTILSAASGMEYNITGFSHCAATSRIIYMASASNSSKWLYSLMLNLLSFTL